MDDDSRRDDRRSRWTPTGFIPDPDDGAPPSPDPPASPESPASQAYADPWLGRTFDDRFEILEAIGHGGMATVYRARESGLISREVAIKLLSRESSQDQTVVARFRREAQLITDIHHPHVVNVFHVGRAEGQLYIVMELLRGQSLQAMLHAHQVLPWSRLAPMVLNICAALQAAHEHKIIHRDIKPSNCFRVDAAGNPDFIKVLDFGIAKAKQLPNSLDEGTQQGTFLGTPHYAAPEIIDPHGGPVDGRVDMYALGVVMYQCLTGSLPFVGTRGVETLHHTLYSRPETPRERAPHADIPASAETLVLRTLARRPEDRFADMGALADAIRDTMSGRGPARRNEMLTGVIEDAPRPRPPQRAPQTRADTPLPRAPDQESTPLSQPQLPRLETRAPSDGSSPSRAGDTGARPVVATFTVMALGVLVLIALLAYEASMPDPADRPTATPPVPTVPTLELAPTVDDTTTDTAVTGSLEATTSTTDSPPTTSGDAPPAREDRQQAIIAALVRSLPQFALRCGIGVVDPWRLQLQLRIAANGNVENVTASTRTLALPIRKCLLDIIRSQRFARDDAPITVVYTLHGGP